MKSVTNAVVGDAFVAYDGAVFTITATDGEIVEARKNDGPARWVTRLALELRLRSGYLKLMD